MAKSQLRGEQIKDETIESVDIASGSIKAGELSAQAVSGQATITSTDTTNDRLLIWDATDSSLKQVSIGNLGVTAGATGSDGQVQYNNGGSAMGGASALYWDDANNRLGIGTASPGSPFTVESTSAFMVTARNTADNVGGAVITVDNSRGGSNGVAEDFCGAVRFDANDAAGNTTQYAKITGIIHSPTDNSEVGRLIFETTTPLANKGVPLYLRGNAVHILSGGASSATDEANGADIAFYVSGTMGSVGTAIRGTSLFGGDLVVSGGLAVNGITFNVDEINSHVGIGIITPKVKLDVHHDPTGLADDTGGGEVVTFGSEDVTDTLAAGKLMLMDSNGVWKYTTANAPAASGGVLLAIALGTSVTDGLLIRGFFDAATIQGSFVKGGACYISEVSGTIDFAAPSAPGDIVRIVGYGTDTPNVVYFNPSSTWIEL